MGFTHAWSRRARPVCGTSLLQGVNRASIGRGPLYRGQRCPPWDRFCAAARAERVGLGVCRQPNRRADTCGKLFVAPTHCDVTEMGRAARVITALTNRRRQLLAILDMATHVSGSRHHRNLPFIIGKIMRVRAAGACKRSTEHRLTGTSRADRPAGGMERDR